MKRKKLIQKISFVVMLVLLTFLLQKLDAQFNPCGNGTCFDYDKAFLVCENLCIARGHIGCAEPWWFAGSCAGMEQCREAFWIICQDAYSVKGFSTDFCAGC